MNIGLDYDDTFTRDPQGWTQFISLMASRGHKVYIVTWRDAWEAQRVLFEMQYWKAEIEGIHPTNRKAKQKYMFDQGICIDVWIDDMPHAIIRDMETR